MYFFLHQVLNLNIFEKHLLHHKLTIKQCQKDSLL